MNGVQTRFKCKLDVKRCKRFVFPPSSLLPRSNALKTKAIRYFQTDRTLTRIVSPPLRNRKKGANEIVFSLQPEAKEIINRYLSKEGKLRFGKYLSYKQIYSLIFRNINKVAEEVGISERYLRNLFSQYLNLSPLDYLNQIRINKAVELLRNTEMSIKEVCFQCGFQSPQYFSRIFKQQMGVSPRDVAK